MSGGNRYKGFGNNLLAVIPQKELERLQPFLAEVNASTHDILHEEGEDVLFAYFPCDGSLISFSVVLGDGMLVETGLIGKEGAAGGIVSQGNVPAYARATVQLGGKFMRISLSDLERAKRRSHTLGHILALYGDCLVAQLLQAIACNARHTIEQRAAKWLLSAYDRTEAVNVPWTHDQLASMLGIGRSYMTRVMTNLRAVGAITTSRGMISIDSLRILDRHCCGCHEVVRLHFDRVLKGVYPIAAF